MIKSLFISKTTIVYSIAISLTLTKENYASLFLCYKKGNNMKKTLLRMCMVNIMFFSIICIACLTTEMLYCAPISEFHDSSGEKFRSSEKKKTKSSDLYDSNKMLKKTADQKGDSWYILLLTFLTGILISFSPWVYPIIPITVGVLSKHRSRSPLYSFFSAITYVIGITIVYALLRYFFSEPMGIMFSSNGLHSWQGVLWIIFSVYLSFSFFGFYQMYIPVANENLKQK